MLLGEPRDRVHVDALIVAAHAIGNRLEPFAGQIDRRAMRQMAARGEIEPHERVARLHQREKHRLIGLAAGIRLHIGESAVEQPLTRSIASVSAMSTNWQPP